MSDAWMFLVGLLAFAAIAFLAHQAIDCAGRGGTMVRAVSWTGYVCADVKEVP